MADFNKAKFLKENYQSARASMETEKEIGLGMRQHEPKYSFAMLQALRDMAKADVYPDGSFGDEECNVWEMFHMLCAK